MCQKNRALAIFLTIAVIAIILGIVFILVWFLAIKKGSSPVILQKAQHAFIDKYLTFRLGELNT